MTEDADEFQGKDIPLMKLADFEGDEAQQKAKEYHDKSLKIQLISFFADPILILVLWLIGLPEILANITGTKYSIFSVTLMFAIITVGMWILTFPLGIAGNSLERRYGFSTQTWKGWFFDQVKGLLLQLILMGIVINLIYFAIDRNPELWWFYSFIGVFIFLAFIQFIAPYVIIPLFMKMESFPEGELRTRIENLAQTMGIKYKDIYLLKMSQQTTKANAMVTGFGSSIRIVLGDTLVSNFRPDEIEIVMAHEIAHQKHKDVYKGILFLAAVLLVSFYLIDLGFDPIVQQFGYNGKSDPRTLFYFYFALDLMTALFRPINNFYSRNREKAADIAAIRQIPNADTYESAFTRLAIQNLAYLYPSKLEVIFNYNHPPIKERIKYGKELADKINSQ